MLLTKLSELYKCSSIVLCGMVLYHTTPTPSKDGTHKDPKHLTQPARSPKNYSPILN